MPIFNSFGKPKSTIVNYMKDIEQKLIPSINNKLDISINNYPSITKETYAIYRDDLNDIELEVSSNNVDLRNKGDLFINVSYDKMREEAGIINLNDISDAVEIVNIALHELGFKSKEEIDKEKEAEQKAKEAEMEKKRQEDEARKLRNQQIKQDIADGKYDEPKEDANEEEPESDNYDEQRNDYINELNSALRFVSDLRGEGQTITLDWLIPIPSEGNSVKMGNISAVLTHVAGNNFLLETKRINPKIEKIVNSEDAKNYLNKVSDKIRTVPVIMLADEKGKEMRIPAEYQGDPVDLGIDI